MNQDDGDTGRKSKEDSELAYLLYDGPLGGELHHNPVDFRDVVRGLNKSSGELKTHWGVRKRMKAAPPL